MNDDLDKEIPLLNPPPRKTRGRPGRPRKNPTTIADNALHELVKGQPVASPGEVEQALAKVEKQWKDTHQTLAPNDVVQIISGDNTGVLIQVGKIEGDTIKGYQIQPHGERPLIDCKIGEAVKIGKGRKAWKMPESDEVPTWHENRPLPQ